MGTSYKFSGERFFSFLFYFSTRGVTKTDEFCYVSVLEGGFSLVHLYTEVDGL